MFLVNQLYSLSLKWKIVVVSTLLIILTAIISCLIFNVQENRNIQNSLQNRSEQILTMLIQSKEISQCSQSQLFDSLTKESVTTTLNLLSVNLKSVLLVIENSKNEILYSQESGKFFQNSQIPYFEESIIFETNNEFILFKKKKVDSIDVSIKIAIEKHKWSHLFPLNGLSIIYLLLVLSILGYFLISRLLEPLEIITITLDDINANNLSTRLVVRNKSKDIIQLVTSINTMIQRIEHSFKQIQQFTSDASHELRTPLAIMMGELEIGLHTSKSKQDFQEVILSALDEVIRLSKVVSSLLELSKAESGKLILQFENTNISDLLLDIIEDAEILSEAKKITLTHTVEKDVMIDIDSSKMHQALLNIIENSIKYTDKEGQVAISLTTDQQYVVIQVKDNGVGMSEEEIPYIFDRFYRADISRSSIIHGTGIGLAIVKWILEGHESITTVSSKPDEGTVFLMKIPKKRKSQ